MKIRPLQDWVLLRPLDVDDTSPGGIFIPDSAKEKPTRGEVLAAGPGRYEDEEKDRKAKGTADKKFIKTEVKAGDKVLYRRFGVDEVDVDGEALLLIRESDILGLL